MSTELIVKNTALFFLSFVPFLSWATSPSPNLLQVHVSKPLEAESTLQALEPWETPISGFFVRSHFGEPVVDPSKWVLIVDGLVETPLKLTLNDLKKLKKQKLHAVLECSGNGRARQTPPAPGVQWIRGAVGNAEWSGASLAEILKLAKVQPNAKFARVEGADHPALPSIPGFVRSVSLEKLMQESTLAAWMMNREPLPLLHGGPLRLVLPGWYGENWIKWLTHITLTEKEDTGYYMKDAYRVPKTPVKPGEAWVSATGAPIHTLLVQSFITSPKSGESVAPKGFEVRGKAFSGETTISKVEISTDQGKTWGLAKLKPPHASGGWQEFEKKISGLKPGPVTLLSRATDSQGRSQPLQQVWNPGGYIRNAVDSVEIQVASIAPIGPTASTVSIDTEQEARGKTLVQQKCTTCHSQELIESQRITPTQWKGVLKKMQKFGVSLDDSERELLLSYLEKFSPALTPQAPKPKSYGALSGRLKIPKDWKNLNRKAGIQLFAQNCVVCHGPAGEGKIGPRLSGRAIPPEDFVQTVLNGKNVMPPFAGRLSPRQIRDIFYSLHTARPDKP